MSILPEIVSASTTDEIKLLLKYHPSEHVYEQVWDIQKEEPLTIKILKVNPRVATPLLAINRLEELRIFLMRNSLEMTIEDLDNVLSKARGKFGILSGWLNCSNLNFSLHGLAEFSGQKDTLLIQNQKESKADMFTIHKSLLNKFWESQKSNLRFIKTYQVRKPI